jgi:hypothetical protein
MAHQTNSDARRGTLLCFEHQSSSSSGLHERRSLNQPGRAPVPLCGMLLPFQEIPTRRKIEIKSDVRDACLEAIPVTWSRSGTIQYFLAGWDSLASAIICTARMRTRAHALMFIPKDAGPPLATA